MPVLTSHLDEASALALGRYFNQLSNRASQVELLLGRLAQSVSPLDPRLAPLIDVARSLVEELRDAAAREGVADRDLAVRQLLPTQAYRMLVRDSEQFSELPDQLESALSDQSSSPEVYARLATAVSGLNNSLQRQADQAIVG